MKTYILTAKVRVDDADISAAIKWEKEKKLDYGDDIAHLLFDCMTDAGKIEFEIINTEIDFEMNVEK